MQVSIQWQDKECRFSDKYFIQRVIRSALTGMGYPKNVSCNVMITDDEGIRTINNEYRQIDSSTDVLSFPALEFEYDGEDYIPLIDKEDFDPETGCLMLGDIVVSMETALRQADKYGHGIRREFGFLLIHSMLHLMGYDHMEDEDRKLMRAKEEELLARAGLGLSEDVTLYKETAEAVEAASVPVGPPAAENTDLDCEELVQIEKEQCHNNELLDRANAAYVCSSTKTGAAIRCGDKIYVGCSIEDAANGIAVSAECNALGAAIAAGERGFDSIAMLTADGKGVLPCGTGRQVLSALDAGKAATVVTLDANGEITVIKLSELLPDLIGTEERNGI